MIKRETERQGQSIFHFQWEQTKKISPPRNNRSCLSKPRYDLSKRNIPWSEKVNQKIFNIEWKNYFYTPLQSVFPQRPEDAEETAWSLCRAA